MTTDNDDEDLSDLIHDVGGDAVVGAAVLLLDLLKDQDVALVDGRIGRQGRVVLTIIKPLYIF